MRLRHHHLLAVLPISLLLAACVTSVAADKTTLEHMADQLLDELEQRADVRNVRVLVHDFTPCERPDSASSRVLSVSGFDRSYSMFARRLKHQLMGALAPKVVVIEGFDETPASPLQPAVASAPKRFADAAELGATAVLIGNYSPASRNEMLLMVRLVDAETNQILATSQGTLPSAATIHMMRE